MILNNDVSQYDFYINSNSKDKFFNKLLNISTIQADPNIEVIDKYNKYINKK